MINRLRTVVEQWLMSSGMSQSVAHNLQFLMNFIFIIVIAVVLYYIFNYLLRTIGKSIIKKSKNQIDDILLEGKFFKRLGLLISLMFIDAGVGNMIEYFQFGFRYISVIIDASYVLVFLSIIHSILSTWEVMYAKKNDNKRSIKNIVQAINLIIGIIAGVVIISILLNKSTSIILKSFGAMSALLMLVFKDTILGFIGGIQLVTNNIVVIGDWIEMPQYGADGNVIEISLVTVKVQNWDNTITTIPTYSLISGSVKNWRLMSDLGKRRIKRAVYIDMSSVKFCDDTFLNKIKQNPILDKFMNAKMLNTTDYNVDIQHNSGDGSVDKLTNLGAFRSYLLYYLRNNPLIDNNSTLLVRQLQSSNYGIPIEIYVFTNTSDWKTYENIQSDIFDHILASVKWFDLIIYQSPSWHDYKTKELFSLKHSNSKTNTDKPEK